MTGILDIPRTLARKALDYWRRLWVRVALMGGAAVLALALTQPLAWLMPGAWQAWIGGAAADRLLDIIAGAMLAVTTFSLTVMVTVFNNVSSQWTPRIHRLAMEDETTLHTLATFLGAWVYAMMAIILRELGVFADDGATVLFGMTVLVLAFVAWSMVRWVLHLQTFGSLLASTRQVEAITRQGLQDRFDTPCLGAHPFTGDPPDGAERVLSRETGYVTRIYEEALDRFCADAGIEMWLLAGPGDFVSQGAPLVAIKGPVPDGIHDALAGRIVLGDVRTHDQDPRFGLVVLSEIASRALSPGINDPGTAIDVITRAERALALYRDECRGDPVWPRLYARPLDPGDLIEDVFAPIARDGAAMIEVQIRLQKALGSLARHPDPGLAQAAREAARLHADRAIAAMDFAPDKERMKVYLEKI